MHVLLVDDHLQSLQVLTSIFTDNWDDITIYQANRGSLALEIAKEKKLDLVVSDWQMPEGNGLELVQALKVLLPNLPVIIFSGLNVNAENLRTALKCGAVDYLRKPLDAIELIARVEHVLALSNAYKKIHYLNESKDLMFSSLSHHLIDTSSKVKVALDLIQHEVSPMTDYLQYLVAETLKVQNQQEQILTGLLKWSQLRFNSRKIHLQPFLIRPFLETLVHRFQTGSQIKIRANSALLIQNDPQILKEIIELLLEFVLSTQVPDSTVHFYVKQPKVFSIHYQAQFGLLSGDLLQKWLNPITAQHGFKQLNLELPLRICQELLTLLGTELKGKSTSDAQDIVFEFSLENDLKQ